MSYDVASLRAQYPALADGHAYLDGAAGTQVPEAVIDAVAEAYRTGIGNTGGAFEASIRSGEIEDECRTAAADLVGGEADGVILGPNMTTLTYRLSSALADGWGPGDEVVVSRLDHDANVRPWMQAAGRAGATVRFAEIDAATGELRPDQYDSLLSEHTKLVALTAASNIIGTRPDVAAVSERARAVGALVYVDGVHWTPHGPVDMGALGADFYATSAYKWSGPHVGIVAANPAVLEGIHPDKLAPASDEVPHRFERGTPSFADFAGVVAAVEHLASLGGGSEAGASRRERVLRSMAAVESYEKELFARLLGGLDAMEHVTTYGRAARRAPTAYFNVRGRSPREVAEHLAAGKVNVWSGDNYAFELVGALGLREGGGAVRAGVVHYNDRGDVDRLLEAVGELA